jgi:hypothetical protein
LQLVTVGAELELVVVVLVLLDRDVVDGECVPGFFQSQLPEWHASPPQKAVPLPQTPLILQHSPHLPAHWRPPC